MITTTHESIFEVLTYNPKEVVLSKMRYYDNSKF